MLTNEQVKQAISGAQHVAALLEVAALTDAAPKLTRDHVEALYRVIHVSRVMLRERDK